MRLLGGTDSPVVSRQRDRGGRLSIAEDVPQELAPSDQSVKVLDIFRASRAGRKALADRTL